MASLLLLLACAPIDDTDVTGDPTAWDAPSNRWYVGQPPGGLAASGYDEGDVPPDVRMPDQFGDEVALWQFHGKLLVLEISPMWCGPCQELARGLEEMVVSYEGTELAYVQLIAEDVEAQPATQENAATWATTFGLVSFPVVADTDGFYQNFGDGSSYPVLVGISRDLRITEAGFAPTSEAEIRAYIDANL